MEEGPSLKLVHPQNEGVLDLGNEIYWFWSRKLPASGHLGVADGPSYI